MANAKSLMNTTMPLSQAMKDAPNVSGCYQIYQGDKLVYVGKAQDGIRKRFVQYYNGTTAHYSSAERILANKDNLSVKWKVIEDPAMVTEQEAKWIRNLKPSWNNQSGWGDKGVLTKSSTTVPKTTGKSTGKGKGLISGTATVTTMAPELALAEMIGASALNAAGGAVVGTALVETLRSIKENENLTKTFGNVVGQGTRAAISAGGGAVAGELAGLAAIALGAGPIGWAAAAIGTGVLTAAGISEATGELADEISYYVSDGFDNFRMNCPVADVTCTVAENIIYEAENLWDSTIGSLFL